jgi:peptide/nickel transport system substrate-binding protein
MNRFVDNTRRRRTRRAAIAVTAAAATALGLAACNSPQAESEERSITIAVSNLFYLDAPYTTALFDFGAQATYEPLVRWSATNELGPVLAEEVTFAEDRKSFTVVLPQDVTFTDGTPLDAEGVKAVFDSMFFDDDSFSKPLVVANGLEIVLVDDYTLRFQADVPIEPGLPIDMGVPSPTAYLDPEIQKTLVDKPVGTGRYIREEVVPEVSATYVRNPDYRDPDAIEFDRITLRIYDDPIAILNALKSGQVDVGQLPPNYVSEAEDAGLSLKILDPTTVNFLAIYDTAGELYPPLADVRVRQAIAYAFDRAAILEQAQHGVGGDSSQIFAEGHPGHLDGEDDRYAYDPERARELMAEAGYADGFDLVIPKPIDESAWSGQYRSELEPIILQSLADIGIRATFEPTEDLTGKNPANAVGYWTLDMNAIYIYSSGRGADDWTRMYGDEGRALLAAIGDGTKSEVGEAWAEFGELVLDEAWIIPVSGVSSGIFATQPDVKIDLPGFEWWLDSIKVAD